VGQLRLFYVFATKPGNTPNSGAIVHGAAGGRRAKSEFNPSFKPFRANRHWPAHLPSPRLLIGLDLGPE
jgi:hypothetical protein